MKQIIFSIVAMLSLFILTFQVNACSCIAGITPKESFDNSEAVFIGKVTDISVPLFEKSSLDSIEVTFDVSQVWLGSDVKTLTVITAQGSASCGYSFEENEEYLVYADREEGQFGTGSCSGTKLLKYAQQDIEELNKIKLPTNPGFSISNSQRWYVGLAIILFAVSILFFWSRNRK